MSFNGVYRRPIPGFTLIELLIVVAIMGVLAALLFPVLARVRENARRATCQSNLKQMGMGVVQYSQDYDERFPPQWNETDTGTNVPAMAWPQLTYPYVKSKQVYVCPSQSYKAGNGYMSDGIWKVTDPVNYAVNVNVINGRFTGPFGLPAQGIPPAYVGLPVARITSAADVFMIFDCDHGRDGDGSPGRHYINDYRYTLASSADHWLPGNKADEPTSTAYGEREEPGRHLEGNNFLYADGHVKWLQHDSTPYTDPRWSIL
jgi:prepilin-type N-terminal cleavage/methylation domain-containing protein/prepilin-type processing-associated H-X9-DG protein